MNGISIFIDESGDLGFDFEKKRTRPHFAIAALVCKNVNAYKGIQKAVERAVKNKINKNSKKKKIIELKGSTTNINTKKYFLKECQHVSDWYLYFYVLNKELIDAEVWSQEDKNRLYNLLAKELIYKIQFDTREHLIDLYLDKHKSRREEKIFNQYIEAHLATKISLQSKLNCYHLDSVACKGIQAIDMFLWGIFEKYNHQKTEWYNLFKQHIEFEDIFRK